MTRPRTRHWLVPALLTLAWATAPPTADADADAPAEKRGWLPVDLTVRFTQGGLSESRDPDGGALGGGQLALDVRLGELPLWLSLAAEYYKKQADAEEPWEINEMSAVYLLYKTALLPRLRSELCLGAGVGTLTTGTDEDAPVVTATAGINRQLYKRWGLWVDVRYLYSRKTRDHVRVVDFSNRGLLVGVTYNTAW